MVRQKLWESFKEAESVIAQVAERKQDMNAIHSFIRKNIDWGNIVHTDEWIGFLELGMQYMHFAVNHTRKQYVMGSSHTNTI